MKVVAVPFEPVSQIDSALKREFPFGDDDVTPPLKDETTIDQVIDVATMVVEGTRFSWKDRDLLRP